jgi:dTDP-3-amino-3,4,6-trideoxy-alpha-D-glucose transaminase
MRDPIPFVALDRQHAELREELRGAFERVVASNGFILGAEVEAFEREFAAACGAAHAVGVASGTAALELLLLAAGIGPGDEVVVPAHTFIASALAVLHVGATPVLADVDEHTALLDPSAAEAAVTQRTTAILAVHLYGQCCDMEALGAVAARHGIRLLEDAAQAHGAAHRGRLAGTLGDGAAFSFYPSKNLGALGDGGAVVTHDEEVASAVRTLRDLGQRGKGNHVVVGRNERLDGLQAALLRAKLPHLQRWNEERRRHAAAYRELLGGTVDFLGEREETPCTFHVFPIRSRGRDALAERLREQRIQTGVHYSPALAEQPALQGRIRVADDAEHARRWAAEELSLPMFAELSDEEVRRVATACLSAAAALR